MASEAKHTSLLNAENLSIGYQQKQQRTVIVEGISFDVNPGELVAVIGANGMGKSTLLRSLANMQPVLGGEVFLNSKNIIELDPSTLAESLSLVLTQQPISKNLSVFELVALGRQPYTNWLGTLNDTDKQEVEKALANVDITSLASKKCYELSDGQLQKVLLARALAQNTPLVILDEPTTHLDLYHQAYIFKLLKKLVRETGKAMLFATHEINLAIQLCDKIFILKNGKFHAGTPCELIEKKVFDEIFPRDLIEFDSKSGTFKIKPE